MPYVAFEELGADLSDDDNLLSTKQLSDFQFLPAPVLSRGNDIVRFGADGKLISGPNAKFSGDQKAVEQAKMEPVLQNRFALLLPCMHDIGLEKIYCRVDGGHDDGFSWVSHGILNNGKLLDAGRLCNQLASSREFSVDLRKRLGWNNDKRSDVTVIRDTLDIDLCSLMWGPWLFGRAFGSGELTFYGAYTVDLSRGTIEEDPNPDPVVQHIALLAK